MGVLLRALKKLFNSKAPNNKPIHLTQKFNHPLDDLVQSAMRKKKNNDVNGAIEVMQSVYILMKSHPELFSEKIACFLPQLLVEDNKNDEAWDLYDEILRRSCRHHRSFVLERMCELLQGQGRSIEAAIYGVLAYLADVNNIICLNAEGFDHVKPYVIQKDKLRKLLYKADRLDRFDEVNTIIRENYYAFHELDIGAIGKDLWKILY